MKRFFIPLLLLFSYAVPAQDWSLSLSSNVDLRTWKLSTKADKEEKSLSGANIKLYRGTEVITEMTSGGNGDFKISVPANGDFVLEVSYAGCNTKKFAISTQGVPEAISKDNFKPSYSIGGFIMARPLPGIDYSYLSQPLVKVVYSSRGQKFEDDGGTTDKSLKALSKIADAENKLLEKYCGTNRDGDAALAKQDCPLAKISYEKALGILPGEAYPTQQLTKVDKCLKDKEAADKKAAEVAAAPKTPSVTAPAVKEDPNKKAVEEAVAKAKADKAAKDQALNDQLVKAAAAQAQKKNAGEKASKSTPAEKAQPVASAQQPTTAPTSKTALIVKEKTAKETEAEKRKAGQAKSLAEDNAAIKADAEKAEAKRSANAKKASEAAAKQKEAEQKKQDEKQAKAKEEQKKEAADKAAKAAEEKKKRDEQQAKNNEEAKKQAADDAAKKQAAQEARDKQEAEAAAKEKEARKKRYDQIEKDYSTGKSKSDHSIPPLLGSNDVYKEKIGKGDDHFNNKRYKEAKTEYEAALKLKPNDEYATSKLAEVNKLLTP